MDREAANSVLNDVVKAELQVMNRRAIGDDMGQPRGMSMYSRRVEWMNNDYGEWGNQWFNGAPNDNAPYQLSGRKPKLSSFDFH